MKGKGYVGLMGLAVVIMIVAGSLMYCAPTAEVTPKAVAPEKMVSAVGTPGITRDAVYLGFNADMSVLGGGSYNAPRLLGIMDAMDYMNENGGVVGKSLKLIWGDHQSVLTKAVSYYEEQVKKCILCLTCSSKENEALKPRFAKDHFVAITCGTSTPALVPIGYIFGVDGIHATDTAHFMRWLVKQPEWSPEKLGRKPRVAGVGLDHPVWRSFYAKEAKDYAEKVGVELLDQIYHPMVLVDPVTTMMIAQKNKVDWLHGFSTWYNLVPLMKVNSERNMGIRFATCAWGVEERTIRDLGSAANGLVATTPWGLWNDETPGVKIMRDVAAKHNRPVEVTGLAGYTMGFQSAIIAKTAIEKAVAECGWDKVRQEDIRLALEEFGPTDILQGLARVDYRKDCHWSKLYRVAEVRNGKWQVVEDWMAAPNMCPAGDVGKTVRDTLGYPDTWGTGKPAPGYRGS